MFGLFIGEHENKIDAKNRLSIPADFRRELEEGDPRWEPGQKASMAIVYGDARRNYLEVLRITDLTAIHRKIARMPPGSLKRADLQRFYANQTLPATLDDTGRIVLPARLREKLGLNGVAMVVGGGDTFRIWHPETYAADAPASVSVHEEDAGYDPALDPSMYLPGEEG